MEPYKQLSSLTHELFRQVVEAAPNAMVMADRDGLIVLVNAQAERLFGYPRDELVGSSVDRLVPERLRRAHPDYRNLFYGDLRSRPMGAGRDRFALRKDGTEVPVEIGLNPEAYSCSPPSSISPNADVWRSASGKRWKLRRMHW
jgi:PAS domain S-box-containing protein